MAVGLSARRRGGHAGRGGTSKQATAFLRPLGVLCAGACGLVTAAQAATLHLALVQRADDERYEQRRVELQYAGHPGGPLGDAIEAALKESQFQLEAARLEVKLDTVDASSADDAKAQLARLEKDGVAAVLLDLPSAWVSAAAPAVRLPLVNVGSGDDALRGAECRANLYHALPGDRMRADALAQFLLSRKWSRVLLLHGTRPEDAARLSTVQATLKRFGLKVAAAKPFKLSADPRERDLANTVLLTGGGVDHDVVWVVDSDGEFARTVPYRTALPRPVVGDAGLWADAWAAHFERFGAPQLARRFAREAKRPMTGHDWAAWMATKAVLQAALEAPNAPGPAQIAKAFAREDFVLDGFKGVRISFRPWDRQLRQPVLLTDGQGVIAIAPVEGVLHPKNVLDTLGADAPESPCRQK
jgi:ABC transporter substrate binding protein (PQQ-dependent alcohol dehydrogenase system)